MNYVSYILTIFLAVLLYLQNEDIKMLNAELSAFKTETRNFTKMEADIMLHQTKRIDALQEQQAHQHPEYEQEIIINRQFLLHLKQLLDKFRI